jgi:hypothetical protein
MAEDAILSAMTLGRLIDEGHRDAAGMLPAHSSDPGHPVWLNSTDRDPCIRLLLSSRLPASHIGRSTALTCPSQIWRAQLQVDGGIP